MGVGFVLICFRKMWEMLGDTCTGQTDPCTRRSALWAARRNVPREVAQQVGLGFEDQSFGHAGFCVAEAEAEAIHALPIFTRWHRAGIKLTALSVPV